jgi:hypothetical protein
MSKKNKVRSTKKDPRCNKCNGQFSSGGVQIRKIPTGFGFDPTGKTDKFQVDVIEVKSYIGFCWDCGDETPVEFSRRKKTKYPRSINNKIKAANL